MGVGRLPFSEMFFATEELHPQSEMVYEVGEDPVLIGEEGVPLPQ